MTKILIAEDEQLIARLYQKKLEHEGFETKHAKDGQELLSLLQAGERPDLILLDIMMPNVSGFKALEEIKKVPDFQSIPVIVLSVLSQDADVKRATELGADSYLVKGDVSIDEFYQKIKAFLTEKGIPVPQKPPAPPLGPTVT